MLYKNIGTILFAFLFIWLFILIIRIKLNLTIYKRKQELLDPVRRTNRNQLAIFLLAVFTLYNRPSKFEDPAFRKLKIRSNILHLVPFYMVPVLVIICIIAQLQYMADHPLESGREKPFKDRSEYLQCRETNQDYDPSFGYPYNEQRKKNGITLLPPNFCLASADERSQVWNNEKSKGKIYYHETKTIYFDKGEWKGEYDTFVYDGEGPLLSVLSVTVLLTDNGWQTIYKYEGEEVTKEKYLETMKDWGLEDEIPGTANGQ